jgi:2-amino-4-hydroxy-6-hydroxymethyldihydropteridine diphosphokinase
MVVSYIAVGSNLGDRRSYIEAALKKIRQLPGTKVRKVSHLIESEPEGGPRGQGRYLNGVVELETEMFPYRLLQELQKIERELGRVRVAVNGPRTIDLDILVYGDAVIREEGLCVPHPRMFSRLFVLQPLEEIAPGATEAIRKLLRRRHQGRGAKKKPRRPVKKAGSRK